MILILNLCLHSTLEAVKGNGIFTVFPSLVAWIPSARENGIGTGGGLWCVPLHNKAERQTESVSLSTLSYIAECELMKRVVCHGYSGVWDTAEARS